MGAWTEYELDLGSLEELSNVQWSLEGGSSLCVGAVLELLLAGAGPLRNTRASLENVTLYGWVPLGRTRLASFRVDGETNRFELRSRPTAWGAASPWILHAEGLMGGGLPKSIRPPATSRVDTQLRASEFYEELAKARVRPAPALQVIRAVEFFEDGSVRAVAAVSDSWSTGAFVLHPAVVDAVVQLAGFLTTRREPGAVYLAQVASVCVTLHQGPPATTIVVVPDAEHVAGALSAYVLSAEETPIAVLTGMRFETAQHGEARHLERCVRDVLGVVRDVTGAREIGVDDDLVVAGATSLDLVRVANALRESMGFCPEVEAILESPTVAAIADQYTRDIDPASRLPAPSLDAASESPQDVGEAQLSHAERRLWYLEQCSNVSPAYNESACWVLDAEPNLAALQGAIDEIVRVHSVLRTVFPELGGEPRRRILENIAVPLRVVDLSVEAAGADLGALQRDEVRRPFDLERGPLLRATLFRGTSSTHVFMLVAHHIVCDEWSVMQILHEQIGRLYAAPGTRLPHASQLQMAGYVGWENAHVRGEYVAALVSDWVEELADMPTVLRLPTDRVRPTRGSHRGERLSFELDSDVVRDLRHVSRRAGVTPFVALLAAYQVLLFRYGAQKQFLVAVPLSLRRGAAMHDLVGCLINTVPLPARLDEAMSLSDVMVAASARVKWALARRDAPFEELVTRLHADRSSGFTPLTQVAFSYHELRNRGCEGGLTLAPGLVSGGTSKFDIMLEVHDFGDRVTCGFEYCADLFDGRRISQMAAHYRAIVAQMAADAATRVGGSWMLSAEELGRLGAFGSGPSVDGSSDPRVAVDARLERRAEAIAVVSAHESVTYRELEARTSRLGSILARRADTKTPIIALCMGRSVEWVVSVLAVLRLGCGYLPIDPRTPPARALELLRSCEVRCLLYTERDCAWATEFDGGRVQVDAAGNSEAWRTPEPVAVKGEETFYSIMTSGSTGRPKAAAVSYRSFTNLLSWYRNAAQPDPDTVFMIASSVGFDLTQKNLFAALAAGSRVVLAPEGPFDPAEMVAAIESHAVSVLNCAPSMFHAVLEQSALHAYAGLASLRWVVLGGEQVDVTKLAPWIASEACRARVLNSYGPTECTDVCVACELTRPLNMKTVAPIGRPIQNADVRVLDPQGQPVPIGVRGELYIGGAALGKGYVRDDPGTRAAFVEVAPGVVMYKSGDLAAYDWDGALTFLGRIDDQIKVRGNRVSLGDIEVALRSHPRVKDALVLPGGTRDGSGGLCAYYTCDGTLLDVDLRVWLAATLPRYMLPSWYVPLAAMPLSGNGKIDRTKLPRTAPGGGSDREHALGGTERVLSLIWKDVLDLAQVRVSDDFFDVGGHSLLAVRLGREVERRLQRRCPVAEIVAHPTIESLARWLDQNLGPATQDQRKPGA